MKKWMTMLALAVAAAGCSDDTAQPLAVGEGGPRMALLGTDADYDGIDDGTELELASRHAPVLYMPNLITKAQADAGTAGDWTWPATVEWYTYNTQLRFHHASCPDHQILNQGSVTTANLVTQRHNGTGSFCTHNSTVYGSDGAGGWSANHHYFLQATNDGATHPGVRDPAQWKTYVHAYRNTLGGVSIQYWFFYAYNDFVASANHEGDWEHVTVRLNASQQVDGVWYAQHNGEVLLSPSQVTWYGGTHPQVWVADGSHASYPAEASCDGIAAEGYDDSCWTNPDQRWFTWAGGKGADRGLQGAGLVNVGEMPLSGTSRRPLAGQEWMKFSGRWGELGEFDATSGPRSPGYQTAFWTRDAI